MNTYEQSVKAPTPADKGGIAKALFVTVMLLTSLRISPAFCQSLPTLNGVTVNSNVTVLSGDILVYSYNVTNPPSNTGSLWLVTLDIRKPAGGADVSGDGLNNDEGFFVNTSKVVQDRLGNQLIPVGIQTPADWNAALTVDGAVQWNASDFSPLINPGGSLSGFQVSSRGLPGIRKITAEAEIDFDTLPITEPASPSDLPRYETDLAAIQARTIVSTTTIGPTVPPKTFVAADFIKTIIFYKESAVKQGWIDNRGIANSLDAKLNAAQVSLADNDTITAQNQLNALLHEIDAQAGKHLTSEAVSLLKFNTQFLISQIK